MIELKNISNKIGDFSLEDINLEVKEGEYFIILGPTGSGKTLLLETIIGIYPSNGEIWINGKDISHVPTEKRNIGLMYQDYMLFPHLNVSENIKFGLKSRKFKSLSDLEIDEKLDVIVDLLGIKHLVFRDVATLSGGEQQRVALARAIVINPDVLLLDEPFSSLDPRTRESLWRELKKIHKEIKTTTIHVTHDFEEALGLADRIAVMNNGKIIQTGTPEEIFRRPGSEFVAEFVGVENLFKGKAIKFKEGIVKVKIDNIEIFAISDKEGKVCVSIRPEDIIILKNVYKCDELTMNRFEGEITEIIDKGVLTKIVVDIGISISLILTRRAYLEEKLTIGSKICIAFKSIDVNVF